MRLAAFFIALFGGIFGLFDAYLQFSGFGQHIHYGSMWVTAVCSVIGIIGGCLLLLKWRYAPLLLLVVAIAGVYPNVILWEGAGSFFLVSALIGFTNRNAGASAPTSKRVE